MLHQCIKEEKKWNGKVEYFLQVESSLKLKIKDISLYQKGQTIPRNKVQTLHELRIYRDLEIRDFSRKQVSEDSTAILTASQEEEGKVPEPSTHPEER